MSHRLSILGTFLGALSLLVAFAYTHLPPGLSAADPGPTRYSVDQPACVTESGAPADDITNRAVTCSDQYAWMKWTELNQPDENGHPVWFKWATNYTTFPKAPRPSECSGDSAGDPNHCPVFGPIAADPTQVGDDTALVTDDDGRILNLDHPSKRLPPLHTRKTRQNAIAELNSGSIPKELGSATLEGTHRNRASFDYIVANKLWYKEGMAEQFDANTEIDFPVDAIELKTNWINLSTVANRDKVAERYYTVNTDYGLYGLVAMHITTKDIPQWYWSTFEHVDNPGRCDYTGCQDSFGQIPALVEPHTVRDSLYNEDRLTAYLQDTMLKDLPEPLRKYYRLKGSQTEFTLPTGEATLLGNSVTEDGIVQTSSCITCHARASYDWKGETMTVGQPNGQSYYGAPDPDWFFASRDQTLTYYQQADFVWSIIKANPIDTTSTGE